MARRHQSSRRGRRRRRPGLGFWSATAVAVLLAAYLGVLELSRPHVSGDELRVDRFVALAEDGRIRSAEILDQDAHVVGHYVGRGGGLRPYYLPYLQDAHPGLVDTLVANGVPTSVDQQFAKSLVLPATILLPALIIVVVFVYLILSWRRGTGLFGIHSGARRVTAEAGGATFTDVAGQGQAVEELREVAGYLADPSRFADVGAQVPKGILLYGPPGCGKTLIARALAGEAGAAFFSISGSDFVEMYVGVGAARVRDLFREARESAPAIVFIDELDAIGRRRTGDGPASAAGGASDERAQALNQLLTEIDGFSSAEAVIVIGATNRPDVLDPALLRPGRFDRSVGLELPGERDRREILRTHARGKGLAPDADLDAIAARAVGMTGADLAALLNEAALRAARDRRSTITQEDLEAALERIREAPERQRRLALRDRSVGAGALGSERVTFADVAGLDAALEELTEICDFLADPERFEQMGARIPGGYLLAGPPGCGKTLLARAVAGEANAAFVSASASEFVEVYVGEGAARVRDLFAQARSLAPAIVFIDELDAIGGRRAHAPADGNERAQTLNQLLVELDGFARRSGVIAIAATNRPDILDAALVRPGRFDRTVSIDFPDRSARRAILAVHAHGKRLAPDVDLDAVARLTQGFSGAALANVLNEAALLATRRGSDRIAVAVMEEAVERVASGVAAGRRLSDDERRAVAYHEAGHGLVALALPGGRVLHKLSVVPRGGTLGAAWLPDADDRTLSSRSLLMERMATLLGGKVAEELVFGEPGDGASSDLARVGELAYAMVARLGMSEAVGAINWDEAASNGRPPYSDATARLIDEESRRLVREAESLARSVLDRSREALDRVAHALLERETLTLADVQAVAGVAGEPARRPAGAGAP